MWIKLKVKWTAREYAWVVADQSLAEYASYSSQQDQLRNQGARWPN
jgi:hypothetical protein